MESTTELANSFTLGEASLGYVQMTLSCVGYHKFIRESSDSVGH